MPSRALVVSAALAAALSATPASATSCPMVVDDAGDAGYTYGDLQLVRLDDRHDIVSLDVATGPTTLVAVMRLADLDLDDPGIVTGEWRMGFSLDGVRHELFLGVALDRHEPSGYRFVSRYDVGLTVVPVTATVDGVTDEITFTAARSDVPGLTAGATFSWVAGVTHVLGAHADTAGDGLNTYVDGDPGCITAA